MWSSFRCRRIDWAVAVLFSFILVGCAARPGPEVLTPVAASTGEKALQIYVATTRVREISSGNVFTANRANALNFAKFVVSVPLNHKSGNVEMPTGTPDSRSSFAVVDQAVMSEGDFRKAVAPQGDTRRKKHKAFVFVHGFNSNFQESLFRLAQLQADIQIDGIPILFSWPSQGQVAAYEMDKQSASYSRDYLMALLTMLSSSSEVSDIMVVAHSMGAMLNVDDPVVREAALKEKVQIVDISRLAKRDDLGHDQFVSVAVLYSRSHDQAARYRNTAGTFIFADDDETFLRPIDVGNQVAAQ